jgi:hypothetical protein
VLRSATLAQLDQTLEDIKAGYPVLPAQGWLRTIRLALGQTTRQFAQAAGVTHRFAVESMRIRVERSTTTRMARPAWCASEKAGLRRRIFLATNGTTIRARITGIAGRIGNDSVAKHNRTLLQPMGGGTRKVLSIL